MGISLNGYIFLLQKMRWKIVVFVSALFTFGYSVAPRFAVWSMAFASKKGEESSRAARDRIVFCGERAIQPTIASIEVHSPWVRRYCYLPSALKMIGGKAHDELISAIKGQEDEVKRAYLISALQTGFDDYSYLYQVILDFEEERLSSWGLFHMAADVRASFPNAPHLLTEDFKINPAFESFWNQHIESSASF